MRGLHGIPPVVRLLFFGCAATAANELNYEAARGPAQYRNGRYQRCWHIVRWIVKRKQDGRGIARHGRVG